MEYNISEEEAIDIINYMEITAVSLDKEFNGGKTLTKLVEDKEMPTVYYKLVDLVYESNR